ncbi:MAG TPA: hypothetical protein PKU97_06790, partial [Kofleriaceae bacterium]|nr:hypothetical protein [Kofleriaceae bacterium]
DPRDDRRRATGPRRRATAILGAALAAALACVALRGEQVEACGWSGPTVEDLSTFDPMILGGVSEGLHYNPYEAGFSRMCMEDCKDLAMLADWQGYLGQEISAGDWEEVLYRASDEQLSAMIEVLSQKRKDKPAGFEGSSLWTATAARAKLKAALPLVRLIRQVEPLASSESKPAKAAAAAQLLAQAKAGVRASRAPFLAQRYAFQLVKILFYQQRWEEVVQAAEQHAAQLGAPSQDLAWRARYYAAGALLRLGQRARANLELARIHAQAPPLAGLAANDFRPVEESDWRESLRLAKTVRDKTELWRLVGLTRDGIVAMREIIKLDARSPLLALLLVREVERAESRTADAFGIAHDPKAAERQRKDFAALEQLATSIAQAGGDQPWLATLVAGHLAAKRGDLASAKSRLAQALHAQPQNARVRNQVQASLALALASGAPGKGFPLAARADEISQAMLELEPTFGRYRRVSTDVRGLLASAYATTGKLVEAELLQPGFLESQPGTAGKWRDPAFLRALLARTGKQATPLDRFLTKDSYTPAQVERELALYHLTSGAFAQAAKVFAAGTAASGKLGTDPFAIRILDCHDCDHARYADAPWTHASFAARLAQLEQAAKGKGEPAAEAALTLGNALYNITWYGNARVVLADTHQTLRAPKAAERWYKRAHELSRSRERRAKAAFLAAKAELGSLITAAEQAEDFQGSSLSIDPLPIPTTWFPVVETYADTRYYREILAECSHFRAWTQRPVGR